MQVTIDPTDSSASELSDYRQLQNFQEVGNSNTYCYLLNEKLAQDFLAVEETIYLDELLKSLVFIYMEVSFLGV